MFHLIEALSLNREAFAYLIQEQREGLLGLRGLLCDNCLSDQETVESGPHSLKLLLSYQIVAFQNKRMVSKLNERWPLWMLRFFWRTLFLS